LGFGFAFKSYLVGVGGAGAAVAIYFLELLVAFIQAYVFTFLVTVFLGSAVHPEH
jgi:F-type H+-transporting ATPase subunit a